MNKPAYQDFWGPKRFALHSANAKEFPEEHLARLGRRGWQLGLASSNVRECLQALHEGSCQILIIHDSPETPASLMMRAQIVDPVGVITPTLVTLDRSHEQEGALLKDFGEPVLVFDLKNIISFTDSFEWMLQRWSTGNLKKLLKAKQSFIEGDHKATALQFAQLRIEQDIKHLVTPCVAQLLLKQGQFAAAEQYLIDALKSYPRNLGLIANLVELYLMGAMPKTALMILEAARKVHGNVRIMYPDQVQANLMLNRVTECIDLLEAMIEENYRRTEAAQFLLRCLLSEGYVDRFEKTAKRLKINYEDYKASWSQLAG